MGDNVASFDSEYDRLTTRRTELENFRKVVKLVISMNDNSE